MERASVPNVHETDATGAWPVGLRGAAPAGSMHARACGSRKVPHRDLRISRNRSLEFRSRHVRAQALDGGHVGSWGHHVRAWNMQMLMRMHLKVETFLHTPHAQDRVSGREPSEASPVRRSPAWRCPVRRSPARQSPARQGPARQSPRGKQGPRREPQWPQLEPLCEMLCVVLCKTPRNGLDPGRSSLGKLKTRGMCNIVRTAFGERRRPAYKHKAWTGSPTDTRLGGTGSYISSVITPTPDSR